jgi:hypothetical protein
MRNFTVHLNTVTDKIQFFKGSTFNLSNVNIMNQNYCLTRFKMCMKYMQWNLILYAPQAKDQTYVPVKWLIMKLNIMVTAKLQNHAAILCALSEEQITTAFI